MFYSSISLNLFVVCCCHSLSTVWKYLFGLTSLYCLRKFLMKSVIVRYQFNRDELYFFWFLFWYQFFYWCHNFWAWRLQHNHYINWIDFSLFCHHFQICFEEYSSDHSLDLIPLKQLDYWKICFSWILHYPVDSKYLIMCFIFLKISLIKSMENFSYLFFMLSGLS